MEKPIYRVPSMEEIRAIPWNGFNAVSTFSGCGGSSLGYRMAGFKILWASEFIDSARDSYKANSEVHTILDPRDIRNVKASDILSDIDLKQGELDLLDGSPPCSSFSTSGKGSKLWGVSKKYSDKKQRTDDLFFEYIRLIDGIKPKVFIAENVSGLVKGAAKGLFKQFLGLMKECGYKVSCKLLDAQYLGVPQRRVRTIFVGVRDDLNINPTHPKPLKYRYSLREALQPFLEESKSNENKELDPELDISRFAIGTEWDIMGKPGTVSEKYFDLIRPHIGKPCPTVKARGTGSVASVVHPLQKRTFSIQELKRISGFPDDFVLMGDIKKQWERIGRSVPPVMMSHIASTVRDEILIRSKNENT